MIAELPPEPRTRVEARHQELKQEVEGLRELRAIVGKAQLDMAAALHIRQPSVSKIEKQTDMYLSTLRNYIEAIGGELELIVKLPKQPAIRLHQLGLRRGRAHRDLWRNDDVCRSEQGDCPPIL